MDNAHRAAGSERAVVRIGVLGAGYFASIHHAAWASLPGARLVAVADADAERASAAAARVDARPFPALGPMLGASLDVLDIATPPDTHADAIRTALRAGVRTVICQKPFTRSLAEAEEIAAEAQAARATLFVHENFRFQPWHRAAAAAIREGAVGTPFSTAFRLRPGDGSGADAYLARQPYFRTMPRFLLRETGVHFIDLFRFLLGEVEAVFADLRRLNPAIAGEDTALLILRHAGGSRSLFDGNRLSDHVASDRRRTMGEMLVEGSEGSLRLDGEGRLWHRRIGTNEETAWPQGPIGEGFGGGCVAAMQAHVLKHLRGDGPAENLAWDYLPNLRVEEAAYRSAKSGRWERP